MNDNDVTQKYGVDKGMGIMLGCQIILLVIAFGLTMLGIVRSRDVNRLIIYIGQAGTCLASLIYIIVLFRRKCVKHFRILIYSYAFLEALRAALLHTENVDHIAGYIARFILIVLACNCVLLAERCDDPNSIKVTYGLIVFEVILYIVFLVGFPGVLVGHFNKFLPIVGILLSGTISLFQAARFQQKIEPEKLD